MNKYLIAGIVALVVIVAGYFLVKKSALNNNSLPNLEESTAVSSSNSVTQAQKEGYTDLSPAAAQKLITDNPDLIVIDVSPVFSKGHLPGAVNYYVGDNSLAKAIPNLDKEKTYLVYCHVDSASIAGAEQLVAAEFPNVYRLEGNYAAWVEAGYPVEIMLTSVSKRGGIGIAAVSFNKETQTFNHTVAIQLDPPAEGKFYEGWLVKDGPVPQFFSTGKMEANDSGQYTLSYSAKEDKREYNRVVITEETEENGLDGKPEEHILEGMFEN